MKKHLLFFCFSLCCLLSPASAQQAGFECIATFTKHSSEVTALCFSPDSRYLLTGSSKGEIYIWDMSTLQFVQQLGGQQGKITDIIFSNNGKQVATAAYDGTVRLWNWPSKTLTKTFINPGIPPYDGLNGNEPTFAAFSADDKCLYFGGYNLKVLQVGVQDGSSKVIHTDAINGITCGRLSTDQKYVVFAAANVIRYFNPATGQIEKQYAVTFSNTINDWVCELAFSPDQQWLAAWTYGGDVVFFKATSLTYSHHIRASTQVNSSGLAFSTDSKMLATGNVAQNVVLWSVQDKTQLQVLTGHGAPSQVFAFSGNGKLLATGSHDKQVKLWRVKPPEPVDVAANPPVTVTTPDISQFENGGIKVGQHIVLKTLQFEQSQAVMLSSSYRELDRLAELMKKYPKLEIRLDGHTDNVGDPGKNLELSDKRVKAVKAYLVNVKNVPGARITTQAFGDVQPIADNANEETRKLNRRVEVKVVGF